MAADAAGEGRDVVPAADRVIHDGPAEEACSPEHKKSHDRQSCPAARLRAASSADGGPRAPGNRTAGLAAPGLPLAALSSVASQPGWLPPPPCQVLPGSPLPDPAPYCRAL